MNEIGFENFKTFRDKVYFDFRNISLLTGTNNSGKSSVLNGIKLFKENFKSIKYNETSSDLGLDQILDLKISTGEMLKRYGNLEMFVNRKSEKAEFSFYFKKAMYAIDDTVEIKITIGVYDDFEKSGFINNVSMTSLKSGKVIFQAKNNSGTNGTMKTCKIDFTFFYQVFFDRLKRYDQYISSIKKLVKLSKNNNVDNTELQNEINLFNNKFNDALMIATPLNEARYIIEHPEIGRPAYLFKDEELLLLKEDVEKGSLFLNKSSLGLESDQKKLEEFEKTILNFYKSDLKICYANFNLDVFKFLSEIDWTCYDGFVDDDKLDFLFRMENERRQALNIKDSKKEYFCGIGLKRFTETFTNVNRTPTTLWTHSTINQELIVYEDKIKKSIAKYKKFYNNILKPLLEQLYISESASPEFSFSMFSNSNSFKDIKFNFSQSEFSRMIFQNIQLIPQAIQSITGTHIKSYRTGFERSFSISDENNSIVTAIRKIENLSEVERNEKYQFINTWLKHFGIADELILENDKETDNFKLYFLKNKIKSLIADYGYGSSQILPLILSLVPYKSKYADFFGEDEFFASETIYIEEPEANLHPALQSKLADFFVEVSKYNFNLIIETHSEYLIRKLQYLVSTKKISNQNCVIYYLYEYDHKDVLNGAFDQVKKIEIRPDGILNEDFGNGFFDESARWSFELLKLKNLN